jgi:hypothetical protein
MRGDYMNPRDNKHNNQQALPNQDTKEIVNFNPIFLRGPLPPLRQRAAAPADQKVLETIYEAKDGTRIVDREDHSPRDLAARGFRRQA